MKTSPVYLRDHRKKGTALLLSIALFLICLFSISAPAATLSGDSQKLVNFLKTKVTTEDRNQPLDGTGHYPRIPISYYITPDFWKKVCETETCTPLDTNEPKGPAYQLLTERILATVGTNLYDAAVHQITMAVTGNMTLADNQDRFLNTGHTADGNADSTLAATSNGEIFLYGSQKLPITDKKHALMFRMIGPTYWNTDPLAGWNGIPANTGQTWVDWKPISGENAWASYIGPLQKLYKKYQGNMAAIPLADLERSHTILTAVIAMQAPIGAIYYTTTGVSPNSGVGQVNPYMVSLENNFSMLAGLSMYRAVLMKQNPTAVFSGGVTVSAELERVNQVITKLTDFIKTYAYDRDNHYFYQGGLANDPTQDKVWVPTTQPYAVDVQTWGTSVLGPKRIDEWFGAGTAYQMWQKVKETAGYFGEGGGAGGPVQGVGYSNQVVPITEASVTITVINRNGDSNPVHNLRAFALWVSGEPAVQISSGEIAFGQSQQVTVPMHSSTNSPLASIQFIDQNNNQVALAGPADFNQGAELSVSWNAIATTFTYMPRHDILSAEWTFGAINAVEAMMDYYQNDGTRHGSLQSDSASMRQGVLALRTDHTSDSGLDPSTDMAYLYSNKRYAIPFGWMANPVPSTCSTGWAVLTELNFNPFYLGGARPVDPLVGPSG